LSCEEPDAGIHGVGAEGSENHSLHAVGEV
jgi:hypothetical protein